MKITIIVVYASDSLHIGTCCGPETIARLEECIALIREKKFRHSKVILAAGINPHLPKSVPMKILMRNYLQKRLLEEHLKAVVEVSTDNVWGTFNETRSAIAMTNDATTVFIISSWYHLPRIKFTWKLLSNVHTRSIPVYYWKRWYNPCLEPLKMIKILIMYVRYRNKITLNS